MTAAAILRQQRRLRPILPPCGARVVRAEVRARGECRGLYLGASVRLCAIGVKPPQKEWHHGLRVGFQSPETRELVIPDSAISEARP